MSTRKSKGLGERHIRVLNFLREYQTEHNYPPTIREIGKAVGISSTSVVNYYLDQLEKKGLIERQRKLRRGISLSQKVANSALGEVIQVPLTGEIKSEGIMNPKN